jgi:uncharacterized protein (UPF0276 family)
VLAGPIDPDLAFFEVSPENYMRRGGYFPAALHRVAQKRPLLTHGLMLGVGGARLDRDYLTRLRAFLDELGVDRHSDHLCWVGGPGACLHELLPLPFRSATARHVADQLCRAQDALARPIALENISDYAALTRDPNRGRAELEFICEVLERAECGLLLDLNNVAVNAHNHGHDAQAFIAGLPLDRVVQLHVAGGEQRPELGLLIDTHGAPVAPAVKALLVWTLARTGPLPVLYERDHNIPPYPELLDELRELAVVYRAGIAAHEAMDMSHASGQKPVPIDLSKKTCDDATLWSLQSAVVEHITAVAHDGPPRADDGEAQDLLAAAPRVAVYRELVRDAIVAAITRFLPRTQARRGSAFSDDLSAWLAAGGPQSRLLRDLPGEFVAFISPRWHADAPPWLTELAEHELLEYRVAAAPPRPLGVRRPFTLDARIEFDASATLVRYTHAVHRLSDDPEDLRAPAPEPVVLLAYRDEDHSVRFLQLTPLAEAVVGSLLAGATIASAVSAGAAAESAPLDDERLARMSTLLADLAARKAILGPI